MFREYLRVARFFLIQYTKMRENMPNYNNIAKMDKNIPNGLQNIPNNHKIYQYFSL
jgi:hypothetical protein